jgi:hypothetical protein
VYEYNEHDPLYSGLELVALSVRSTPRRHEQEFSLALERIRNCEGATAARLNLRKSKALAVVSWDISVFGIDIPCYQDITILGVRFAQTIMKSSTLSWTVTTRKVKEEVREVYHMYLHLKQRIEYTHTLALARIWYMAQDFPISQENLWQLVTAILVRVSRSDLQGTHYDPSGDSSRRGMDLTAVGVKCTSLFLLRCKHNATCPAH